MEKEEQEEREEQEEKEKGCSAGVRNTPYSKHGVSYRKVHSLLLMKPPPFPPSV